MGGTSEPSNIEFYPNDHKGATSTMTTILLQGTNSPNDSPNERHDLTNSRLEGGQFMKSLN